MKLFSKLRVAAASWLLPRSMVISSQSIPSIHPALTEQLEELCGHLSTLLKLGRSSIQHMDTSHQYRRQEELHQLEIKLSNQELLTEEAETLFQQARGAPHRTYAPAVTHDGMHWVAVAKFIDGTQLVGRGNCPSEALTDYDLQWLGAKGEQ